MDSVNVNQLDPQIETNVLPCSAEIIKGYLNYQLKPKESEMWNATHLTSTPTKNFLEERKRVKTRKGDKKNSKSSASCSRRIQFDKSDRLKDEDPVIGGAVLIYA